MPSLLGQIVSGTETAAARAMRTRVRGVAGALPRSPITPRNAGDGLSKVRSAPVAKIRTPPNVNRPSTVRGAAPSITMPQPSMRSNGRVNGMGAGITGGMLGTSMVVGAATGAFSGATFGNREGTLNGAVKGAMTGALAGSVGGAMMGVGAPAMMKAMTTNSKFMSAAGGHTDTLTQMSGMLHSAEGRNALMASGGLLSGAVFGGTGSKKRGFNQNRGARLNSGGY